MLDCRPMRVPHVLLGLAMSFCAGTAFGTEIERWARVVKAAGVTLD